MSMNSHTPAYVVDVTSKKIIHKILRFILMVRKRLGSVMLGATHIESHVLLHGPTFYARFTMCYESSRARNTHEIQSKPEIGHIVPILRLDFPITPVW